MKINRKDLLEALDKVKPGLSSQDILEQSSSFIFKDGLVFSYNDEIAVRHPLPFEIEEGAVPAKELLKILNRLKDTEISIEMGEEEIRFKGKRAKAGIRREAEIQLPIDETEPPKKFKKLPSNFIEAVSFCLGTISHDLSSPLLNNISVQEDTIQSSDNFNISIMDLDDAIKPFLIPAQSAINLIKYKPTKYAIDKVGFVHFKTEDDTIFSCRTTEGEFPDLRDRAELNGIKVNLPDKLEEVLEVAGTFIEGGIGDTDNTVDISIENNWLIVKGQTDSGWAEAKERIKYKDEPIEFQISPQSLLTIFHQTNEAELDGGVLKFEGEGFIYLSAVIPGEA